MQRSRFRIPQMDCPSEESLIRMRLADLPAVVQLEFDLPGRQLVVFHEGDAAPVAQALVGLNMGSELVETQATTIIPASSADTEQRRLLWTVLLINFAFFVIELTTGLLSRSLGLVADSLDMLADSVVYGLSLLAVGGSALRKRRAATTAGYLQILLALLGFGEVLRRYFFGETLPDFRFMIGVSLAALAANAVCLILLQRSRQREEAHLQASLIFTSNDIIINLGVIVAAVLVALTASPLPDLLIGTVVFVLVLRGAQRILRLG